MTPGWIRFSLLASLLVVLTTLSFDAWSRLEMVEKISAVSFAENPIGRTQVSPGGREENLMLPHSSVDARWWVIHTRQMLREDTWRVRQTPLDNAPEGREVHWSSFLMWILAGLAWIRSIGTGNPAWHFVADAALAAGPLLMAVLFFGLFWSARRAFGFAPALTYLLALLTCNAVVRTFQLGEADHHGIVLAFASACVLFLLAGGSGFAKKNDPVTRNWFVASGLFGAAALWVSAATMLPILAGTGLGALLTGWLFSKSKETPPPQPRLWFVWSIAGCCGSLAFYALEYFPSHMGWRLEVNHPAYAFAWLGGGWLLFQILKGRQEGRIPFRSPGAWIRAGICAFFALTPLLAIAIAGAQVFWVSDTFLLSLHKEYILEFQSLAGLVASKKQGLLAPLLIHFWAMFALIGALSLWIGRGMDTATRHALILLAPPTFVMQTLAFWQVRWSSVAFAIWALWVLILASAIFRLPAGTPWRRSLTASFLLAPWIALLIGPLPMASTTTKEETTCLNAPLSEDVGGNLLVRDIAHRLIQSSPAKIPTVLTGPNTSTELTFHSGIKTLGTLYWENMPGLKRAAAIFAATGEEDTKKLLTEAGVTHIVFPSWSNFGEAYADLLAKSRGHAQAEPSYLDGILKSEDFPTWLRPFAYPIPTSSGIDSQSVRIIAFIPEQNAFESWFYRGVYHFESGQPEKARPAFEKALALRPGDPRVLSYLGNLPPPVP